MGQRNPYFIAKEIKEGNISSFEFFYRLEYDNVTHFIKSYIHDPVAAEDLSQETFCTLWEKRESIDTSKNFRAFVFTIARNKTINAMRIRTLSLDKDERLKMEAELMALSDNSLNGIINALDLKKLISDVYENLPETVKSTFEMSRKQGMSNKEIAQIKGVTTKAVEYHIKISLRIFREKLKDYLPLFIYFLGGF